MVIWHSAHSAKARDLFIPVSVSVHVRACAGKEQQDQEKENKENIASPANAALAQPVQHLPGQQPAKTGYVHFALHCAFQNMWQSR